MWFYLVSWVPMVVIAIANGFFREYVLTKRLSDLRAHQASTAGIILLFGFYIWGLFSIRQPDSSLQAVTIGLLWLVLTVAFEFLFGHYIAGHPWKKLLADYNLFKGRVWLLVLVWVTIGPYVIYRIIG